MNIAFYAPLKPPDHPIPSGDRRMARLLMDALAMAGHRVELASRLRSWDGAGDDARQARLARLGDRLAARLLRRYRADPGMRPDLWFTYHLYYKAPDWIGPTVSRALNIPYIAAEASVAMKRAQGPWARSHAATLGALSQAKTIVALNPADVPALADFAPVRRIAPFLDAGPYRAAAARRDFHRRELAAAQGLDPAQPWLFAVAMMRPGDKLASYRLLAEALKRLAGRSWRLLIAGDGPARQEVEEAFFWAPPGRVVFLGAVSGGDLANLYAACDLLIWPAINEAYGMALLEAQAAGLPAVAGASGGVAATLRDGATGLLTPPGDAAAFAHAVGHLLDAPARRRAMGEAARAHVEAHHDLNRAAAGLDEILRAALTP